MKPQVLIFIYFGGSMLHFVKSFSHGDFNSVPNICQTMTVEHFGAEPQKGEPPYKIHPDNISLTHEDVLNPIEVTLMADKGESFMGFFLEARKPGDTNPQGIFSLTEVDHSQLHQCDGINGNAVTQTNNRAKTQIIVTWKAAESGAYFFRASYVKSLKIFWLPKDVPNTTPAPPATTTVITSDVPSSTLVPPTTTTVITSDVPSSTLVPPTTTTVITSDVPSSTLVPPTTTTVITSGNKPSPKEDWNSLSLTLHVIAYSALAVSSPLLLKDSVCVWMKVTSSLSLAFSLGAFILSILDNGHVSGQILDGVSVTLNMGQTILVFFLCGPSHKLRKIFLCLLRVVAFINLCFTVAPIYLGIVEHYSRNFCIWPSVLMGVYLACHLLSYQFFVFVELKQKNRHQTTLTRQNSLVSCWCTGLVVFSCIIVSLTIAFVLVLYLCD